MSTLLAVLLFIVAVLISMRFFSGRIYDSVIVHMTKTWYAVVLERLPADSRVLDVGIGTASALAANARAVKEKGLRFVGVDYDEAYIERAKQVVEGAGLEKSVDLYCRSIFDAGLGKELLRADGRSFDAVYFSGSISLMPEPARALKLCSEMLAPGGRIYITQTFQKRNVPFGSVVKPLLKYITTIDFGQLTFEADLQRILAAAGMKVEHDEVIRDSVDNYFQAARIIVLDPAGNYEEYPPPCAKKAL